MNIRPVIDVIESSSGDEMYFVRNLEIAKPVFVKEPIGSYIAISMCGARGKKHIFTASEVAHITNMETVSNPSWYNELLQNKKFS